MTYAISRTILLAIGEVINVVIDKTGLPLAKVHPFLN